jgi:uncharacterized protein YbjT (DUF2867 family)
LNVVVVGANGQLGSACCRALAARGHAVRGSVRARSRADGLDLGEAAVVEADLTVRASLEALLADAEAVVLTANSVVPRSGDDPRALAESLLGLVRVAGSHGIRRVVLPSLPVSSVDAHVPLAAERRQLEDEVLRAVPDSVVLRFPPFMECWLALAGSSIPLRGEPNATIGRPSPFLRVFRKGTGTLAERRGLLLVPGPTSNRQAFIAVADAATACAEAVVRADLAGQTLDVGGPEVLTWDDVADIFGRLLGRRVRALSAPVPVFAAASALLGPVAEVPSRTMALNRFLGSSEAPWPPGGGLVDPAAMTTVESLLTAKLALPEALPTVA